MVNRAPEIRSKGPVVEELEGNGEALAEGYDFFVQNIIPVAQYKVCKHGAEIRVVKPDDKPSVVFSELD
jgi:hypothetical protein